jgi:hypothetical protein
MYICMYVCMYVCMCMWRQTGEFQNICLQHTGAIEVTYSITILPHVISGFRGEVEERCALLDYYTASSGNLPIHNNYQITPPKK